MSDIAPIVRRVPVPGRSLWWPVGAGAAGILIPAAIGAATALAAYYPIGSALPPIALFSLTGAVFAIGLTAVMGVAAGIAHSLLARSWRPFLLSIILFGAILLGLHPGVTAYFHLREMAFDLLADRSMSLVEAINRYEHDTSSPPATLVELVPRYLTSVPGTGMSRHPHYEYAIGSGICPEHNSWNITILAGDGLNFDMFFYCPSKNYPADVGGNSVEVTGDWAYMYE